VPEDGAIVDVGRANGGGGGGWKRENKALQKVLQKKKTLKLLKYSTTSASSSASQFAKVTFLRFHVDTERISIPKHLRNSKEIVKCDRCKINVVTLQQHKTEE
jgi:hypothetical protein